MATPFASDQLLSTGDLIRVEDITRDASKNSAFDDHECVLRLSEPQSGLSAIVAIHDTTLGPGLGGTRMWPYATRDEALTDVLRLSRGMTYKAALAGVATGGGKAVIIADSRKDKSEAMLRAYGRGVDRLKGRFITGEDVGISVDDADIVADETRFLLGSRNRGGDPAPATALGVYMGIKAAARHRLGTDDLGGVRIALQGLGHVGRNLAELLMRDGAVLTVTDINAKAMHELNLLHGVATVAPAEIFDVDADVFAPCAMGGVIDDETLPRLKVAIVAGSANNQLADPRHGDELRARNILYAPDYVINGGGLIALSLELTPGGFSWPRARDMVTGIGRTLYEIFTRAAAEGVAPERLADRIAVERLAAARMEPVA